MNNKDTRDLDYEEEMNVLIRKNSFYILIERSIVPIINFLITIYIIRKLSVNEYGIYNILLAVMGYIALFSSMGLPSVFQRYIPEFFQKRQLSQLKKLVNHGLLLRFFLCAAIILLLMLFSNPIGKLFKFNDALQYLIIFSIAIIFYLESGLLSTTLTSIFHHKNYVIAKIICVFFRAGFLYYLLNLGKGLIGLLVAESIAYGSLFFLQYFYYRKFLALHPLTNKDSFPFRRLFKFGGFSYFDEMGNQILNVSTDFFIISAFLGPAAVGVYAFANRLIRLANRILPQSIFLSIIRPAFFTIYSKDSSSENTNRMFNFLMKVTAFITFPLMIGIIILGDKLIIYVFDPKYLDSLKILWIVVAFRGMYVFTEPVALVLKSKEKVEVLFYSKIFAIYNLIADFLVVKPYGIMGIALVTGSAVLFKNIFCYLYARKYARLKPDFKGLGIIGFNSILMGVILYLGRPLITNIATFIIIIFIGGLVYFFAAYINKAFSNNERSTLNKILPKPVFVF